MDPHEDTGKFPCSVYSEATLSHVRSTKVNRLSPFSFIIGFQWADNNFPVAFFVCLFVCLFVVFCFVLFFFTILTLHRRSSEIEHYITFQKQFAVFGDFVYDWPKDSFHRPLCVLPQLHHDVQRVIIPLKKQVSLKAITKKITRYQW